MGMAIEVGTAAAGPGEVSEGWFDATDLPTGGSERLPVTVVNGEEEGPTLWVTATIHGDEVTALAAAHELVRDGRAASLASEIRGALVVMPLLNPAGFRLTQRTSYYGDDDPNRYFPDPDVEHVRPPRVQERIDERLFEAFTEQAPADCLLDLHCAQIRSIPFVIRDRVLYGEERTEAEAEALAEALDDLAHSLGIPVINEYVPEEYVDENLQRSTAGAALNNAGIRSLTLELGGHTIVEDENRDRGVMAVCNAMVHLGMLDDVPAWVTGVPYPSPVEYDVRRAVHPHAPEAGIARTLVEAGEVCEEGDVVAEIVDAHGNAKHEVSVEHDGYVVGRYDGTAVYENDPLLSLAVRDESPLVTPRNPDE